MGALDKPIADAVLTHALDTTRVEASLRLQVMKRMLRMQRELVAMLNEAQPKTKAATDALLARANKVIAKCYDDIHEFMQPALTSIAKTQTAHVVRAINSAPVPKQRG